MSGGDVSDRQANLDQFSGSPTDPSIVDDGPEDSTEADEESITSVDDNGTASERDTLSKSKDIDSELQSSLLESYIRKRIKDNRLSPNTVDKSYRSAIRQFLDYINEDGIDVESATSEHIRDFLTSLTDTHRQATIDKKLAAVRDFFRYLSAYRTELNLSMNFARLQDLKSPDSVLSTMSRKSLTREEVAKLLQELDRPRDRLMVIFGVLRGPRPGAICELKVDDVDLISGEVELQDMKADETYTLPLGDKLVRYLEHWLNHIRPSYLNSDENPYMFPPNSGTDPISVVTFQTIVRKAAKEAEIQESLGEIQLTENQLKDWNGPGKTRNMLKVTPHAFRHTFNNFLKDQGVPIEARSNLLNHNNVEVTKEFYDDEIENVEEFLDDLEDVL